MLSLSHHMVSGQNNFNSLYHIWVLLTIRLPVASLPSCVWDNKNAAHLPDSRYSGDCFWKTVPSAFQQHLSIFASQKETKVLSEALHEMKEENKLLKQKNASMIRKKEHYECEISRLNKVWTRVSHWLGPLPLILGSVLSSSDTTSCPSFQSWVKNPFVVANAWWLFGSWGNKQEL